MDSLSSRFTGAYPLAVSFRRSLLTFAAARLRPDWIRSLAAADLSGIETFHAPRIGLPDGRRLSVIAPHPDDESIGCGGLIALWTAAGREAEVIFMTAGEAGNRDLRRAGTPPQDRIMIAARTAAIRREEAEAALATLGARAGLWLDGRDGALHRDTGRLAARIAQHWRHAPPDLIAMPFPSDRHRDHAAAARIGTLAATRVLSLETPVWGYEVWSPCPANAVIDIRSVATRKAEAISAHRSQIETTDYGAAAEALATYRAVTVGLGAGAAEAAHLAPLADMSRIVAALRL